MTLVEALDMVTAATENCVLAEAAHYSSMMSRIEAEEAAKSLGASASDLIEAVDLGADRASSFLEHG